MDMDETISLMRVECLVLSCIITILTVKCCLILWFKRIGLLDKMLKVENEKIVYLTGQLNDLNTNLTLFVLTWMMDNNREKLLSDCIH